MLGGGVVVAHVIIVTSLSPKMAFPIFIQFLGIRDLDLDWACQKLLSRTASSMLDTFISFLSFYSCWIFLNIPHHLLRSVAPQFQSTLRSDLSLLSRASQGNSPSLVSSPPWKNIWKKYHKNKTQYSFKVCLMSSWSPLKDRLLEDC